MMFRDRRRYAASRVGQALLAVVLVYCVIFIIVTVLPGDPISNRLRDPENNYSEEEITALVAYYGLDRSPLEQLVVALPRFFVGDFGISLTSHRQVADIVLEAIPPTLQLASLALVLALGAALLIVLACHFTRFRFIRNLLRMLPPFFQSLPSYLLGLIIIQVFSMQLGLFRVTDYNGPTALVFAALALALPVAAPIAQVLLTSVDSAKANPSYGFAVSKGLGTAQVFYRHILPVAALPAFTMIAIAVAELLGGSLITEAIFGRKGLGSVVNAAVLDQDVPVLQAAVTLSAVVFLIVNLLVDLTYPSLDPRLRTLTGRATKSAESRLEPAV